MNDLMTRSFLNYADLKKQASKDRQSEELSESITGFPLNLEDEENLSVFFQETERIKAHIEEAVSLLRDLQALNRETKSTHSLKILRDLRDTMDSKTVAILRKVRSIKAQLDSLDESNFENRRTFVRFCRGSAVDRTRIAITNGMRFRLKGMMNDFTVLREKITDDHREETSKEYYNAFGESPTEEITEKLVSGSMEIEMVQGGKLGLDSESKDRHEVVVDIKKSLDRLQQVFLDMAALIDAQGDQLDDIEKNVASAGEYISGGTNSLYYAKQMKKKGRMWVYWVLALGIVILLVCLVAALTS